MCWSPRSIRRAASSAFKLLDIAGGTGDIALRVLAAGGAGTRATVVDINREMLAVGRERAVSLKAEIELYRRQRRGAAVSRPRL